MRRHHRSRPIHRALAASAAVATLAGCLASPEDHTREGQGLLSGADDRKEVYAHENAWMRSYAEQATVALIPRDSFEIVNGREYLNANGLPLGYVRNLCPGEPYADQQVQARCSGTLIDDDLVLTAGHCMAAADACAATRFVFNDYYSAPGVRHAVTPDDIFRCSGIVAMQSVGLAGGGADYAVVRLDRAATPRFQPAPVRRASGALEVGQHVKVAGFPDGIPAKIDAEGNVNDDVCALADGTPVFCAPFPAAARTGYFIASLDVFGGNSGSGVYESDGYTLAGVHTAARIVPSLTEETLDYSPAPDGRACNVRSSCDTPGCATGIAYYTSDVIAALCRVPGASARLCGAGAPANDRLGAATEIVPVFGQQRTYGGSTLGAAHDLTPSCARSSVAPDVFYRFTLAEPAAFYADAFTSDFPAVLHLRTPGGSTDLQCSANACGAGVGQLAVVLAPGTYYLGVKGTGSSAGRFNLHVQFLSASNRSGWFVPPTSATAPPRPLTARRNGAFSGDTTGAESHAAGSCGGLGGDDVYFFTTCPDFRGATLRVGAVGVATPGAVYHLRQGNSLLTACNAVPTPLARAPLFEIMPGSGVRALYIDSAVEHAGPYAVSYNFLPR